MVGFRRQAVCPLGFGRQKINAGFPEDKNPDAGSSFRKRKSWDGMPDFQRRRHMQKSLPREVGPALLYTVIIFRLPLLSPSLLHDATACTTLSYEGTGRKGTGCALFNDRPRSLSQQSKTNVCFLQLLVILSPFVLLGF